MLNKFKSWPRPQLTLRTKLILSFVGLLFVIAGISAFNLSQMDGIHNQMINQNEQMTKQQLALDLKIKTNETDSIKSAFIISKDEKMIALFEQKKAEFLNLVKAVSDTASNADQRKWSAKLTNTSTEYTATFDSAVEITRNKTLSPAQMNEQLAKLHELSQVHKDYIFELVDQFNEAYQKDVQTAVEESNIYLEDSRNASITTLVVVLIINAVVAFLLIRSFLKPIRRLQMAVKLIAQGDLRHKINNASQDELGILSRDFDVMIDQVRNMLTSTQTIASSLSSHSVLFREFSVSTASANKDIVRAIQDISTGAEQQAHYTELSSTTVSELAQQVREIAESTDKMQRMSREAEFNTHTGSKSMEELKSAARHSEDVLHHVYSTMETLSQSSAQIGKIVGTITEISTQTNVLALNAAIEAARAGVHGKGFSVIAEEVRQLSSQTNDSSKMIAVIVKSLTEQIGELEGSLSEAKTSFKQQNIKMEDSIDAFQEIRSSMKELTGLITQIHERIAAAEDQNQQIVASIQHVAAIAEETAAGVEEVNSSSLQQDDAIHQIASKSDEMMVLTQQLFTEINRFLIEDSDRNDNNSPLVQANPSQGGAVRNDAEPLERVPVQEPETSLNQMENQAEEARVETEESKAEEEKKLQPV